MCEQVAPYLQFVQDGSLGDLGKSAVQDRYNLLKPLLTDIQNGEEKDFGGGLLTSRIAASLDRTGIRKADVRKIPEETVSGWATGPIVDSFTGAMIAGGSIDRAPGNYTKDDKGRELGETYEMIHPCVKYRMSKVPNYKPKALRGFERADGYRRRRYESIFRRTSGRRLRNECGWLVVLRPQPRDLSAPGRGPDAAADHSRDRHRPRRGDRHPEPRHHGDRNR